MMYALAFAAGMFGGVLGFWVMFALAEWILAPHDEPRRKPRDLGPHGYRAHWDPLA